MDLPSGIKVTHALWESGNAEAFLKHVMAEMSYFAKKVYICEYEKAKSDSGLAVYKDKVREDLYLAAPDAPEGAASPELAACAVAEAKVRDKNLAMSEVARKMFILYKNLLTKMLGTKGPPSWTPKSMHQRGRT